jgi:hypothetical protein
LLGYGERSGNVDIVTIAMNLHSPEGFNRALWAMRIEANPLRAARCRRARVHGQSGSGRPRLRLRGSLARVCAEHAS